METKLIDHLFRHHYGKMVSVLTRIFGLSHLETIEDAVQDTFVKATLSWKNKPPQNPEAWLTKAAKNRVLDIFRKLNSERKRVPQVSASQDAMAVNDLFLDSEIADSQLRMIFTACHPSLSKSDRIAFSLKTISGFNAAEIASALLSKEETIKKRLSRARKTIQKKNILFKIPVGEELPRRIESVLEVLYLIFNEGFHSNRTDILVRTELCGEAMRLCQILLKNPKTRADDCYALFALMCFHSARLDSKVSKEQEIIDLENQDRSTWHVPFIHLGNEAMNKAVINNRFSHFHYEAAIASEHIKALSYKDTNWQKILMWYNKLYQMQPSAITALHIAIVQIQLQNYKEANQLLINIEPASLGKRAYLYYGVMAENYKKQNKIEKALLSLELAINIVVNNAEREYLIKKKLKFQS